MSDVSLLVDCRNSLAEGILWDERTSMLFWTDINGKALYRWSEKAGSVEKKELPEKLGSFAFTEDERFLFAFASCISLGSWESDVYEKLTRIRPEEFPVRLNDGRCDRKGRFVVGEYDPDSLSRGRVYQVREDGQVKELLDGMNSSNSICFSPEGKTMYVSDTPKDKIWTYDYESETGTVKNRRVFADFSDQPGSPDGSIIDAEGCLWNAQWGGSRIVRFTPEGKINRVIEVPSKNITCLCFGGRDLDTLFISTAREGMSEQEEEEYPHAGGIFSVQADVHGIPEVHCR